MIVLRNMDGTVGWVGDRGPHPQEWFVRDLTLDERLCTFDDVLGSVRPRGWLRRYVRECRLWPPPRPANFVLDASEPIATIENSIWLYVEAPLPSQLPPQVAMVRLHEAQVERQRLDALCDQLLARNTKATALGFAGVARDAWLEGRRDEARRLLLQALPEPIALAVATSWFVAEWRSAVDAEQTTPEAP